jgi:hypothetical protein
MSMQWGNWMFDTKHFVLTHRRSGYSIHLADCRDAAEVLDWIAQVRGKTWAGAHDVNDLVEALDEILGLQANICSNGKSKRVDPRRVAATRGYRLP